MASHPKPQKSVAFFNLLNFLPALNILRHLTFWKLKKESGVKVKENNKKHKKGGAKERLKKSLKILYGF